MLTLIAESKTMTSDEHSVSSEMLDMHTPAFEKEAASIVHFLSMLPITEISERLSISPTLARKATKYIYEFPNKSMGNKAIFSFTGEVFRGLGIRNLPEDALNHSRNHLMFVSSLYGLLKPFDLIKPYRLDFSADCAPDGGRLNKFWKSRLTAALVKNLRESGEKEVLDLLPGEASKCIDWKIVKAFASVMKVDFKTIADNGDLKTPHSGKIKELRGKMVRKILLDKIDRLSELILIDTMDFKADPELYKPGLSTFITLQP